MDKTLTWKIVQITWRVYNRNVTLNFLVNEWIRTVKITPSGCRTSNLVVFGPLMTKFAPSEAIFWSRRAIKEGATKKVLAIKLATPGNEPRRSPMARRGKTWNRRGKNWGNLPDGLSGGSRLQNCLSSLFGATYFHPVIFIFCELVLWIFF